MNKFYICLLGLLFFLENLETVDSGNSKVVHEKLSRKQKVWEELRKNRRFVLSLEICVFPWK